MGAKSIIHKFLIDTANSDSINGAVNASGGVRTYRYTSTHVSHIYRLTIFVEDATNLAATYGGVTALSNGVAIKVFNSDDTELVDITDGVTIKTNRDFESHGLEAKYSNHGSGNESVRAIKEFDSPLVLNPGDYIAVTINDDLTGLVTHSFSVEGELA